MGLTFHPACVPINSQFYFSQNQFLGEVLKAPKSRKGSSEKKKKSGAPLSIVACVVVFFFVVVAFFSHVYCTTYRVGVVYCVLLAAVGVYAVSTFLYTQDWFYLLSCFFFPTMSNWKSGVYRKGKQNGHDKWWTFTAKRRPCVNSTTTAVDAIKLPYPIPSRRGRKKKFGPQERALWYETETSGIGFRLDFLLQKGRVQHEQPGIAAVQFLFSP